SMLSASLLLFFLALGFQAPVHIEPALKPITARENPAADLHVDVPLVLIPVQVSNALGAPVSGLRKEDFRVIDDDVEQRIAHFSKEDTPLSIGLLVDASGSMRNKMRKAIAAVTTFFKTVSPGDEFFLIEFSDRPKMLVPFTENSNLIRTRLAHVKPFGRTALLDAIGMALAEMKAARNPRKVI